MTTLKKFGKLEKLNNQSVSLVSQISNGMKVLMLSTDQNIFMDDSSSQERMKNYGDLFDELHVVVYTTKDGKQVLKKIEENIFIYPTKTRFKLFYFFNAYKISKKILVTSYKLKVKSWVVTCQDPFETGLVGYFLKLFKSIPLQIQVHTDFLSPYFWCESFKNKIRVILGKWLVQKADGLRVVSERIKNSLSYKLQVVSSKIVVLPIVYDMDRFNESKINIDLHKKYSNYDFIILVASRLTIEKNIDMAIDAMIEVVKINPRSMLLIVGEGPEEKKLKSKISSLKLGNNIVFESWTKDIASYYKTADIFVLTSNYEGGARSPSEATASRIPVIMTDVAPANEVIINGVNGFVIPVGNSGIFADRIIELMSNKEKCVKFSQNALNMSKSFISKEEYMKRYKNTLTSVIS